MKLAYCSRTKSHPAWNCYFTGSEQEVKAHLETCLLTPVPCLAQACVQCKRQDFKMGPEESASFKGRSHDGLR